MFLYRPAAIYLRLSLIVLIILLLLSGCERPTDITQTDSGIPPAVPIGLHVAYANDGLIAIEWQNNVEADLNGYNVYRSTDSTKFTFIYFTNNNYYLDDSLNYNTTYFYKITAVDIWNKESQLTGIVSAKPVNIYTPSTPRGLSINARNWEGKLLVYLSWLPNTEGDIAGFNIYKSLSPNFNADSATYIGFTKDINFSDTTNLSLYTQYYYRIKAVDKGGLQSDQTSIVNDEIYEIPQIIFPVDGSQTNYFYNFLIKAINVPANYKIIVQDNMFFGEFWSKDFFSSTVNDTISVTFDPTYLNSNTTYYWRVATFSQDGTNPNSVSPLYKFVINQ